MPLYRLIIVCFGLLIVGSCALLYGKNAELVMSPGSVVEATTYDGTIKIEATRKFTRVYSWRSRYEELYQETFRLTPRSERWYGSLGAYKPSGNRKMHAVLEEGQQHFCAESDVYDWLDWIGYHLNYVYNDSGLIIGWRFQEKDKFKALHVNLWQVYINGQKPKKLIGSQSALIHTASKNDSKIILPASGYTPNCQKVIDGIVFSGRAIDGMDELGMTIENVKKTIEKGEIYQQDYFVSYHWRPDKSSIPYHVVLDDKGKVLFILR